MALSDPRRARAFRGGRYRTDLAQGLATTPLMLEPSASRLWHAALQSGLMDAAGLQACWDALSPEKRTPDAIDRRLARQAVQSGRLTLWQAQQLVSGRSTGFKIGRYTLLDLLGQGGMGRVYLARDTRLNRLVAVKILSPERVNNPRAIARFHREALVGAQLQHEHLVRIYDEGESHGRCYLVMEYIEGKNIGQMIAEAGRIPPGVAARLARQVALGLEHAQRKGLIHRDVNPYNILVTREGVAKLTDMGLAIDLADQERVTRDGATVGTFDYVSPEQARHSHDVDSRSDIYSLGCSLYHMISGQVPFPSPSLPQKLLGHQAVDPEPLDRAVPGVPPGLAAVVAKMMRKLPADRYPNPLEVARALEPFADDGAAAAGGLSQTSPAADGNGRGDGNVGELAGPSRSTSSGIEAAPSGLLPEVVSSPDGGAGPVLEITAPHGTESFSPAEFAEIATLASEPGAAPVAVSPAPIQAPVLLTFDLSAQPVSVPEAADGPAAPTLPSSLGPTPATLIKPKASGAAPGVNLGALNLSVDLGPEPPLTEGLGLGPTRNRAKPKEKEQENEKDGPKPGAVAAAESLWDRRAELVAGLGLPREWLVPAAGAAALVLALGGALVAYRSVAGGGEAPTAKVNGHGGASTGNTGAGSGATPGKEEPDVPPPTTVANPPSRPTLKGQEIEAVAADETMSVQPDFRNAVRTAIGSRGYVLLRNAKPLRLNSETIVASGGPLTIRAGDGAMPVLEVVVRRGKPFLLTRPNSPLRIEGVTVVVHYADTGPEPPPVIDAGASVTFDRCAFRVEGPERGLVAGSRAVVMEGGSLTATGCWFENFERALDLATFSGSTASITQCMFIHNRKGGEGPSASEDTNSDANANGPAGGWAVRLRCMPGGLPKVGRKLVMEHCTAHGRGFLDFAGFSDLAPARVDLRGCAVLADALVAWETVAPRGTPADAPSRDCLSWLGEGNQFDIRGKSWLLLAPRDGPPEAMPGGPVDLEGWNRAFGNERDPVLPPLRFAADPSAIPEHPTPADFAVAADKGSSRTIGADPARVGPTALPRSASRKPSGRTKGND